MSKKAFWVFQGEDFWRGGFRPFMGMYAPLCTTDIWIARPVDDPIEAERLYKLNHNPERANKEWSFLNNVYPMYCNLFPKSWMK